LPIGNSDPRSSLLRVSALGRDRKVGESRMTVQLFAAFVSLGPWRVSQAEGVAQWAEGATPSRPGGSSRHTAQRA
jgi:hypothetical protein